MKTIFTQPTKWMPGNGILEIIIAALMLLTFTSNAQSGSGGGKLSFRNPSLKSGTAGADGATYLFSNIGENLDALVTIKSRSDKYVYLKTIDMTSSGFDKAWQPQIGYDKNRKSTAKDWFMEFEMSMFSSGTSIPAILDEFHISAIDIDGNGANLREYVDFRGLSEYKIEGFSQLKVTDITGLIDGLLRNIGARFEGTNKTYSNIDTNKTDVMVTAKYLNTQKFLVRLGATAKKSSMSDERMYSLYFQDFKYTEPVNATLPLRLKRFDATVHDAKVSLNWSTAEEVNFSHFMVQRSNDGRSFSDVTMVVSNSHGLDYSYRFTESFNQHSTGIVYYRLKMADLDGTFKYSAIRIVKLNASNKNVAINTYPNPVTSELRITIPYSWQNKPVTYDIMNMKGNLVEQRVATHASQTETFNMKDMNAGIYVIRLKSGNDAASKQVIKR